MTTCKHNYKPWANIIGDEAQALLNGNKTILMCTKCGKKHFSKEFLLAPISFNKLLYNLATFDPKAKTDYNILLSKSLASPGSMRLYEKYFVQDYTTAEDDIVAHNAETISDVLEPEMYIEDIIETCEENV